MRASCIRPERQSTGRGLQQGALSFSNISSLPTLLQDCIRRKDASEGEIAYSQIVRNGLQGHHYLSCLLVRLLSACGYLHRACHVFLDMGEHTVYSWTSIIESHVQHSHYLQTLTYYELMLQSSVKEIPPTFVAVLKACDKLCDLEKGMLIHADIAHQGLHGDVYIQSALLSMYANCGCVQDMQNLFYGLQVRDHAIWSVMVKGCLQHNQVQKALGLVEEMQYQGFQPNKPTFLILFKALSNTNFMIEKERLYSKIVILGLECDTHIGSSILRMYFKCHRLTEAFYVSRSFSFDQDVVAWNVIIDGMAEHGHHADAFQQFEKMKREKVSPSDATFVSLLKCVASADESRLIHMGVMKLGLEFHLQVHSSLIHTYVKYCCLSDGRHMLDRIDGHDDVSWSSIMSGYVDQGQNIQAIELYMKMLHKGLKPDEYIYSCLLRATNTLHFGYLIHAEIVEEALECSLFVGNDIINMYCVCGSLECAQVGFDLLKARNAVSFSTLISGCVVNGNGDRALQLFLQSWEESVNLDSVIVLCVLKACTSTLSLTEATLIYSAIVEHGLDEEMEIGSALVDLFSKSGSLENANKVFKMLHIHDIVTYSALISSYVEHEHFETALELLKKMQHEGLQPDAVTWVSLLQACSGLCSIQHGKMLHADAVRQGYDSNVYLGSALVNMYANFRELGDARKIFDGLQSKDAVLWSATISGYVECEYYEEAIKLYTEMQKIGKPNSVTFLLVLKACSNLPNLHCGMSIHDEFRREGLELDAKVGIALVDMYFKCGDIKNAIRVYKRLKDHDWVSWSTLIAGCADHGLSELVLCHFKRMQDTGVLLDTGLFVCLLGACSHGGLIDEGLHLFNALSKDDSVALKIEHCACLVDSLARAGCVKEAKIMVLKVPFQPNSVVWMSLQSSCLTHSNMDMASQSFAFLEEFSCRNSLAYT